MSSFNYIDNLDTNTKYYENDLIPWIEETTVRIFKEIENDIEILYKYHYNLVKLDGFKKKDIIERHAKYPWAKRIKSFLKDKDYIYHIDIVKEYLIKWDLDIKCFIMAVIMDNINLVSYYVLKGVVYEDPEIIKKRHNDEVYSKHPILDAAFNIATVMGYIRMMTFLWNVTPTPYLDLTISNVKKAGNIHARMFLAQHIVDNEWKYEIEMNVVSFLQYVKEKGFLDIYKFLDKEDGVDVSDYKKVVMISLQHGHFDIFDHLVNIHLYLKF
jgi:hypothetical protein